MAKDQEFIGAEAASQAIGISKHTITSAVYGGRIKCKKRDGKCVFTLGELQRFKKRWLQSPQRGNHHNRKKPGKRMQLASMEFAPVASLHTDRGEILEALEGLIVMKSTQVINGEALLRAIKVLKAALT
jgi:hypothetical protein